MTCKRARIDRSGVFFFRTNRDSQFGIVEFPRTFSMDAKAGEPRVARFGPFWPVLAPG